jgi:hypothetical protein
VNRPIRITHRLILFWVLLALIIAALAYGAFSLQTAYKLIKFVAIDANRGWQDTGITIVQGDQISIRYILGRWFEDPPGYWRDASGGPNPWICAAPACHEPSHDFPKYALIGKIGDSDTVLRIGNFLEVVSEANGTLYLRPNYGEDDMVVFNPQGAVIMEVIIH